MTADQFREMRQKLVSVKVRPWHEIDAILNEYAHYAPEGTDPRPCGCGQFTFSRNWQNFTHLDTVHRPGQPCLRADAS